MKGYIDKLVGRWTIGYGRLLSQHLQRPRPHILGELEVLGARLYDAKIGPDRIARNYRSKPEALEKANGAALPSGAPASAPPSAAMRS